MNKKCNVRGCTAFALYVTRSYVRNELVYLCSGHGEEFRKLGYSVKLIGK